MTKILYREDGVHLVDIVAVLLSCIQLVHKSLIVCDIYVAIVVPVKDSPSLPTDT